MPGPSKRSGGTRGKYGKPVSSGASKRAAAAKTLLEAKPGAIASSGPIKGVTLHKVMGKMFAILILRSEESVILKCDPDLVEILREKYEGVGHKSHLDKRFWIDVQLNADVPAAEIKHLIQRSYELVCAGLTRKQQAELAALSS